MEYVYFSNGVKMPSEGFGVFQVSDLAVCKQAVIDAISTGYRLIDTAAFYNNEEAVGEAVAEAIARGIVIREELFITTKLWPSDASYEGVKKAFIRSLSKLQLTYLDMFMIHQPYGDVYGAWRAMTELYNDGKIKAMGVANFYLPKFTEFAEIVEIKPHVNQIEMHPFYTRYEEIDNMKKYGTIPQAWAPLAEGKHNMFTHPMLTEIGQKYGKTSAQVALKWNVQRGVSIIPKSVHKERMEQNIDIWNFDLTDTEMDLINTLDIGHSDIVNHNDPNAIKFVLSVKAE